MPYDTWQNSEGVFILKSAYTKLRYIELSIGITATIPTCSCMFSKAATNNCLCLSMKSIQKGANKQNTEKFCIMYSQSTDIYLLRYNIYQRFSENVRKNCFSVLLFS